MLILSLGPDEQPIASGSGVVIAPETVVTNCHVVVKTAYVIVRDGDVDYPATSKTSDRMFDLCLLSVPTLTAKEVKIGSVNNVHVGEPVYAIGAPHGQQRTLSEGNVSALLDGPDGPIIQSTAVIAPGSSGGGLFSADGRLVGITTAQSRASNLVNLAVPIDWLDKLESR
jgi:S1-C subfamily serine protease